MLSLFFLSLFLPYLSCVDVFEENNVQNNDLNVSVLAILERVIDALYGHEILVPTSEDPPATLS